MKHPNREIDYWNWLYACMIDCVPSYGNIVIQFWVCSNHFTYMCYLCYCCFLCLLYLWFAYVAQFVRLTHTHLISLWKSCFAKIWQRGEILIPFDWLHYEKNMEYTRYFCEARTHVGQDVPACVQHLALVSRPMLLLF